MEQTQSSTAKTPPSASGGPGPKSGLTATNEAGWVARLVDAVRLYCRYIGVSLRAQMQYKTSFWMLSFTQFIASGSAFIGMWVLFTRFGSLRGWSMPEVALFYGVINVSFAFADSFGRGFDVFSNQIKSGDFDRVLLRPRSLALQIGAQELLLTRIGRFTQAGLVLGWALHTLPLTWTIYKVLFLTATIAGGAALFYGLYVLQATMSFWTIDSLELMNILTYGGTEIGQYPLTIYRAGFRWFFTFVVPIACVNFIPIRAVLQASPAGFVYLAPLAGWLFLAVALQIWRLGVRKYTSTGS